MPLLPSADDNSKPKMGRPGLNKTVLLSVIVEKLKNGKSWGDVDSQGKSAYRLFSELSNAGIISDIWKAVVANKAALGFSQDHIIAATEWLIKQKEIEGPLEAWIGHDYEPPTDPTPERQGPIPKKRKRRPIRSVDERLMAIIRPIFEEAFPLKSGKGRPRLPLENIFNGLIRQARSGSQWEDLTHEFGHPSTIWLWRKKMKAAGVYDRLHRAVVAEADRIGLVKWEIQALDGSYSKARLGGDGVGPCPVDRAKTGIKRSILCDGGGLPLSVVVAAANVSDNTLVRDTLSKTVFPAVGPETKPLLLLDRGYYGPRVKKEVEDLGYQYQVPPRPKDDPYYRLERES